MQATTWYFRPCLGRVVPTLGFGRKRPLELPAKQPLESPAKPRVRQMLCGHAVRLAASKYIPASALLIDALTAMQIQKDPPTHQMRADAGRLGQHISGDTSDATV